ncbi:MAG: type IV toxin-antitoxin system AbiEi family antitoxin domain-containing protein, partial [Candidatus Melainabacteria bacterium]|nr:type IV toxin-antitoxin system AbiEi family antitoxin domain-containing protein [Candidatus Melainabacteria bacterium]
MFTSSFIKRHIYRLPLDKIFSTRDFLIYGSRTAVDQTLAKLVKKGMIIRLARGVFVK